MYAYRRINIPNEHLGLATWHRLNTVEPRMIYVYCLDIKFDVFLHHVLNLVNRHHVHKLYKMLYKQISNHD